MSTRPLPNTQSAEAGLPQRPPFWLRLSIRAGSLLQLAGLVIGAVVLAVDGSIQTGASIRFLIMLAGWLAIYICCHAFAHWLIGRLVGIEFQGYGIRGTDHPENYPPVLRQMMSALPTFTVMTKKTSMQKASPVAKALMFSAGESSTAICSMLAAGYAWLRDIPGAEPFFWFVVILNLISTVTTSILPRGDYAKAWRALHPPQN